jgi:hypothetical protein
MSVRNLEPPVPITSAACYLLPQLNNPCEQ